MDSLRRDLKAAVRRRIRTARRRAADRPDAAAGRAREAQDILRHGAPLVDLVRATARTGRAPRIAAYHPTPAEADPLPLVRELADAGAEIVLPVSPEGPERPGDLDWVRWDGLAQVSPSAATGFGAEPEGPRLGADALAGALLVLAPAVAVDVTGSRIGHGAGYYDRALARAGAEVLVVAVVHPEEVLPPGAVPTTPLDVPVHAVLTAQGLRTLRAHPALGDMIDGGA